MSFGYFVVSTCTTWSTNPQSQVQPAQRRFPSLEKQLMLAFNDVLLNSVQTCIFFFFQKSPTQTESITRCHTETAVRWNSVIALSSCITLMEIKHEYSPGCESTLQRVPLVWKQCQISPPCDVWELSLPNAGPTSASSQQHICAPSVVGSACGGGPCFFVDEGSRYTWHTHSWPKLGPLMW